MRSPKVSINQSMDERIAEFKNDPQKMDVTTKFVNDVIEKAKEEAMKRMKDGGRVSSIFFKIKFYWLGL